jgi:hypothetical protein
LHNAKPSAYFENKSTFQMEEKTNFEKDLASIRDMMERSVKVISLSGLAGIMAGFYALAASTYVYFQVYLERVSRSNDYFKDVPQRVSHLLVVASITLIASLVTGWYFSYRKARRVGASLWNEPSRRLLVNLSVPLCAGGIFALIIIWHGYFGLVAPICLLFYGLALINASPNLFDEIRYLGYCQLVLGILSSIFIGYGLFFWAFGFGVLHIVYGVLMYRKYDA